MMQSGALDGPAVPPSLPDFNFSTRDRLARSLRSPALPCAPLALPSRALRARCTARCATHAGSSSRIVVYELAAAAAAPCLGMRRRCPLSLSLGTAWGNCVFPSG